MMRSIQIALLVGGLAACTPAPPEQQALEAAAEALGGRDQVLAVTTLMLEGEGTNWNVGQDMTIDATGQTFAVTGYRRAMDLGAGRLRVHQTRTPNFLYFQGQAPQTQTFGLDGDVAYTIGANGSASRAPAQVASDRRAELHHHPLVLVRAALDPQATIEHARTEGGEQLLDVTLPGGLALTLALDATTHLPSRVMSRSAHPNLGDVVIETAFADYVDVSGLKLPERLITTIDRFKSAELHLARPTVNSELGDIAAPALARDAAVPSPPAVNVVPDALAPGVWLMGGQSHHSAVVEFSDHLLLIEAPQSEARSLAVIAAARELVPGKPVTRLVSTHHHFDHSTGFRAAVAEGLTVITKQANVAYYEEAATRPHTIQPDQLARSPRPATIEGVDDTRLLEDATRRVELYHIAGNPHADTLLMAYLPKERLLIQVDAFSPASSVHPFAATLLENIRTRKLRVDRIVPLHGPVVPFADLVKAVPAS